jgi:hypothetical protein
MQRTREQLFARAAFTGDEHRGVRVGDGGHQTTQGVGDRTRTNEKGRRIHAWVIVAEGLESASRQKYSTAQVSGLKEVGAVVDSSHVPHEAQLVWMSRASMLHIERKSP